MITLSKTLFSKIQRHGEEAFPYECCGALFGSIEPIASTKSESRSLLVQEIQRVENSWEEKKLKYRRFKIMPHDYVKLEKHAKSQGVTLLGFYHTHPDHPAVPSATDLLYAWPVFSYCILSVEKGIAKEMRSYLLAGSSDSNKIVISEATGKSFVEEDVLLVDQK